MLIDSSHPEETRVVVTKDNRLEDFDFESEHKKQIRGNIYLAKVTRVEPSLQAAFVEYGGNRHGFLAFSEIHPDYYQIPLADRQALLEEEAAMAEQEREDDDSAASDAEPAADEGDGRRRNRRNRRGRRNKDRNNRGPKRASNVPDAEPVAMDDILAAWEAAQADADNEEAPKTIAADISDDNAVSEALDQVFGALDTSADGDDEDDEDVDADDEDGDDDTTETISKDDAIDESRPRRRPTRRQYKIQEVIKRRQIILVQVMKEERGNKGAALTTYLSLAGRYSVLMPNTARGGGISRKITNAGDRTRMKEIVRELDVPKGMGVILRTAGADQSNAEIRRDYDYLMRLWNNIRDLTLKSTAPSLVYEEGNLIKRSIRDLFHPEISEITVAGGEAYQEAKEFMRMLMPSHAKIVKPWRDAQPIFARTGIEAELDRLVQPQVTLKSGGYIIINQTEALVAIDVNSGKSTKEMSVEETALATNLEAAEEVARQLRLRDLAGLIVIDFIDMDENRNNRAVEKKLKECLKPDRARIQIGRISHFGLMEMSRQRMRASVLESTMTMCPHCEGTGYVRSVQSLSLHLLRAIEDQLQRSAKNDLIVQTATESALYVLNNKREMLTFLEKRFGVAIMIEANNALGSEPYKIIKGEPSSAFADPDAHQPVGALLEDDPEQAEADDAAFAAYMASASSDSDADDDDDQDQKSSGRKRRRRRRGKRSDADAGNDRDDTAESDADDGDDGDAGSDNDDDDTDDNRQRGKGRNRRRSRGRRGGRNRRGRRNVVPDAEPVGPLADLIARQAEEAEAEAKSRTDATPQAEVDVPDAVAVEAVTAAPVNDNAQPDTTPQPVAEPETVAVIEEKGDSQTTGSDDDEAAPSRVRATASTLNLDVKPVVSSTTEAEAKPKRGWWSRK